MSNARINTNPPNVTAPAPVPGAPPIYHGIATEFWLELDAYPDQQKSLWLLVERTWYRMDDPPGNVQTSVQAAFSYCPSHLAVEVWYNTSTKLIVGLVVRSRK